MCALFIYLDLISLVYSTYFFDGNMCSMFLLFCLFSNSFECLFHFLSIFTCFLSKIQKHIKVENLKSLISIVMFCHTHVLPCTFIQMALCIYEHSLFFVHLYHCGKNLDIYVIIINRSSNLSWMISQLFCWSWDMNRLVPIYLPTLLCF